jgi:hypothetical protein
MPIHFEDLDVLSEVTGVSSALIVPCNMCPAVTVAVREEEPFLRFFRSPLKSTPFYRYIKALQSGLEENGVRTEVFSSMIPHQWFMCMWTSSHRKKLQKYARQHDAMIVLGCQSATETVRDAVGGTSCRIIEGMQTSGIMNARLALHWPDKITFDDCTIVPIDLLAED